MSYTQLGKVLVLQGDVPAALHTYSQALDVSPENADTLTQVGLLQLRQGAPLCRVWLHALLEGRSSLC